MTHNVCGFRTFTKCVNSTSSGVTTQCVNITSSNTRWIRETYHNINKIIVTYIAYDLYLTFIIIILNHFLRLVTFQTTALRRPFILQQLNPTAIQLKSYSAVVPSQKSIITNYLNIF